MADYEITITLSGETVKPVGVPDPMRLGKTVRYSCLDGDVSLTFRAGDALNPNAFKSPFNVDQILGGETVTLMHAGKFKCNCSVTPHGKTESIGWHGNADSGGDHNVEP